MKLTLILLSPSSSKFKFTKWFKFSILLILLEDKKSLFRFVKLSNPSISFILLNDKSKISKFTKHPKFSILVIWLSYSSSSFNVTKWSKFSIFVIIFQRKYNFSTHVSGSKFCNLLMRPWFKSNSKHSGSIIIISLTVGPFPPSSAFSGDAGIQKIVFMIENIKYFEKIPSLSPLPLAGTGIIEMKICSLHSLWA